MVKSEVRVIDVVVQKVVGGMFSGGNEFYIDSSLVPVELGQPSQQSVENGEEGNVGDVLLAQVVPGFD